ncbi:MULTISPECIES: PseG/SpsG family protein [Streptomyces]|uniref:PseG/SpsG family protein n=1 Tax=Streptomyces TaxID=1883 RepID=UPI0036AA9ABD
MNAAAQPTVAFRADASAQLGTGHVMRCLALAEEVAGQGGRPVLVGDVSGVPWLEGELRTQGVEVVLPPARPDALAGLLRALEPRAVVMDAYHLPADDYTAAATVAPVVAFYDGETRDARGDVMVDQNIGADLRPPDAVPSGAIPLRGPAYSVVRERVRSLRPAERPKALGGDAQSTPRVLLVLGGTDAQGATRDVARVILSHGAPIHLTAVTPDPDGIADLPRGRHQQVEVLGPTPRLPEIMSSADLVVSAAGTTIAELSCLGVPAALIAVVDNQRPFYAGAVAAGCALGLGTLEEVLTNPSRATAEVWRLLESPAEREALADTGWKLVDGLGRARILASVAEMTNERTWSQP